MSLSELLYRFFSAFDGFSTELPLGFEAEVPRERGTSGAPGAVLRIEPARGKPRRYINGKAVVQGMCSVTRRVPDSDIGRRLRTAEWFSALADYADTHGTSFSAEDGSAVITVRTASAPARTRLTADGALWEMTFSYEVYTGVKR